MENVSFLNRLIIIIHALVFKIVNHNATSIKYKTIVKSNARPKYIILPSLLSVIPQFRICFHNKEGWVGIGKSENLFPIFSTINVCPILCYFSISVKGTT